MPKALGLVETRGLVAAIEAADAMVKTSNVSLIGKEVTNPALITIKIVGDVAAVKAAVDAGAAAAARVGELVSIHVIPQPDSQLTSLFPEIRDDDDQGSGRKPKPESRKKPESDKSVAESKETEAVKDSAAADISSDRESSEISNAVPGGESVTEITAAKPSAASKPDPDESKPTETSKENYGSIKDKLAGGDISTGEEADSKPVPARKPASTKAPVSKPVKSFAPKRSKESDNDNLFTVNTDHLERLRREALGIKESKETKQTKPAEKPGAETPVKTDKVQVELNLRELEKLNVHNLRKTARAFEGFPIQGREISRANRRELLDLFKKIL